MSMIYWMCQGIGVRTNDLYPYLDNKKCIAVIKSQIQDVDIDEEDSFDIDEFFWGEPFENLGDLLCHVDDTDTMTWGDNGDGEHYFYYVPSYPWERKENEPISIQEVHERIIDAVLRLCNMTRKEVEALIDNDIYDYGCG